MKEVLKIGSSPTSTSITQSDQDPLIEFKNISKAYGDTLAIKDINLKIMSGEFICIVGQSGVGKTTLIKMLICQERPTHGWIFVAGRNLADLRTREVPYYRRKIGVVFQDFKLLPQKTVRENIAFALEVCGQTGSEVRRKTDRVLDLVGLNKRANFYPEEISGGERQRTAIARALVNGPRILVADEPTGNLDPVNTWEIIELLYRINQKNTTIVLATHNKHVVDRIGKRVVLIKSGVVISDQKVGKYVI